MITEATELQRYKFAPQIVALNPAVSVQPVRVKKEQPSCKFCGYRHSFAHPTGCPAFKKNCKICNKTAHFAKMCRNKQKKEPEVHSVEREYDSSESDETHTYFGSIEVGSVLKKEQSKKGLINVKIAGKEVNLKADTGAEATAIPYNLY